MKQNRLCHIVRVFDFVQWSNYSCVFQSVLKVLGSPNSWDAFRRAGGFTGLLSLVIDMEGALSDPPRGEVWESLGYRSLMELLLLCLHILNLAVHLHTVNAHHFETGGFYERLGEALLQLGCFHSEKNTFNGGLVSYGKISEGNQSSGKSFHQYVKLAEASSASTPQLNLPLALRTCIRLLFYLDQFATGAYSPMDLQEPENVSDADIEIPNRPAGQEGVYSRSPVVHLGSGPQSVEDTQGRSRSTSTSFSTVCTETSDRWIFGSQSHSHRKLFYLIIICFILVMNIYVFVCVFPLVDLPMIIIFFIQEQSELSWLSFRQCLPQKTHRYLSGNASHTDVSCFIIHMWSEHSRNSFPVCQLSLEVQFSVAHHIQAMVKSEQNRQVLCNGRLVSTLLDHCRSMLLDPNHPLHLPVTRILEKLSSQAICHADFR